jgi:hypothetical protein
MTMVYALLTINTKGSFAKASVDVRLAKWDTANAAMFIRVDTAASPLTATLLVQRKARVLLK